jgi:hypothetical protein
MAQAAQRFSDGRLVFCGRAALASVAVRKYRLLTISSWTICGN